MDNEGNGDGGAGPRQIRTRISIGRTAAPSQASLVPTLQVVEGPGVGRWHRFAPQVVASLTVGRTADAQFVLDHPSVSRVHAKFTWLRMGSEFFMHMEDQQSTNGCTVNGERVSTVYLKPGDLVGVGDVILRFQMLSAGELSERDRLIARATLAETDPLTGLGTRLYMEEAVPRLCAECDARKFALSLLVIDLDHFKRVNDSLGHPAGDQVLSAIGRVLLGGIRDSDVAIRFGGEEFLTFLPGIDLERSAAVAERLRAAVAAFDASSIAPGLKLTVSIGAAERSAGEPFDALLRRADQALYRAKSGGRNRVELDRLESSPAAAG